MPGQDPAKDFFISYTAVDRTWAEWIAWELEKAGYDIVIQAWDFRPGENFVVEMQNAAAEAARTLLVLSEDYLRSSFARSEWAAAFAQDPTGDRAILVPVRVGPCEPTGLLKSIIFIDLLSLDEAAARDKLLAGIEEARAKPPVAPRYPGTARPTSGPTFPGPAKDTTLDPGTAEEAETRPADPVRVVVAGLKTVGTCAAGFSALAIAAGYLAEGSYSRLLGLDFDASLSSSLILSGAQFFISLVTSLLQISLALVALVLLAVGVHFLLRWLRPSWSFTSFRHRLFMQPLLLLALQALAASVLIVLSLPAFADLMPLASLPTRSGILSADLTLIRRGPHLYDIAVLWAAGVCLALVGLETWRLRLHWTIGFRRSWARMLSLLLALPLYFCALIELMLLPMGYGLLYLPNSRQHEARVVTFRPDGGNKELNGRTFRLFCLKENGGRHTFFCPDPPRVWTVDETQFLTGDEWATGSILTLLPGFHPGGCELKPPSGTTPP